MTSGLESTATRAAEEVNLSDGDSMLVPPETRRRMTQKQTEETLCVNYHNFQ